MSKLSKNAGKKLITSRHIQPMMQNLFCSLEKKHHFKYGTCDAPEP